MKFARFTLSNEEKIRYGIISKGRIEEINGDIFSDWQFTGKTFSDLEVQFIAPLEPNQIIGIGLNYVETIEERPEIIPDIPVFFFKPISSVIGSGTPIVIPSTLTEVKFESELAVVIGKKAKNVSEDEILDYVFGYTVSNDVTAPQYFHSEGHWMVGKSFDTFTPLGPVIETEMDPDSVRVRSFLNGVKKQDSSTGLMIINIRQMLSYLTRVMTLSPGDVVLTGSPVGAEFLKEDDIIECVIDEIGTLRNSVITSVEKARTI
ncbi:fumarylacetoacetate hydrolase family protein [Scopulibacillus cellulosilyticus]|uniref:Fumarylacetoacetate hydrolase family protein n=1 Tax=Scopulibacillus cellulosilyticus TaxID=2665665 RepID=A0ABW2PVG8_9BACL